MQIDVINFEFVMINNDRHKITIINISNHYDISKYFEINSNDKLHFIHRVILNIDNVFKSQIIEFIHNQMSKICSTYIIHMFN